VDVPFGAGVTAQLITQWLKTDNGVLALRAQGQILSLETPLTVETDDRGVYIDQGETQRIALQVRYKNEVPPAGTNVYVFQYFPWLLKLGSGSWSLFGSTPPPTSEDPGVEVCNVLPRTSFLNIPQFVLSVDDKGNAGVNVSSQAPGFPILVYYPVKGLTVEFQASVNFGFIPPPKFSIGTSYYSVARVLPFNDDLYSQFVHCWNGTGSYAGQPQYDRLQAWRFVYGKILYVYDMIFPVMDLFMPLGDLMRVEGGDRPADGDDHRGHGSLQHALHAGDPRPVRRQAQGPRSLGKPGGPQVPADADLESRPSLSQPSLSRRTPPNREREG
jgi:hypothetical protein